MSSDSDQVVEIKKDEVECNHRIDKLYSHRSCTKSAQLCEQRCKVNLTHDYPKIYHQLTSLDQFKQKFAHLEETSTKQTQHYIRQLNDIERNALEKIARKKEECLKEINQFKKDLMFQTYKDLQKQFPNLYQKFKNQRFDTINCNEVFWVMNTNKHQHSLKPSQINTKLVAILKKFQNYKDVSKNLSPNIFINKEKAKNLKIMQKGMEPVIRVMSNINLQKPNYSQDKSKQQLFYLQKKKRQLEDLINNLTRQNNRLSDEISNKMFEKRERQRKIRVVNKNISLHLENIKEFSKQLPDNNYIQQEQGSECSQLSVQKKQRNRIITNTFLKLQNEQRQLPPATQFVISQVTNQQKKTVSTNQIIKNIEKQNNFVQGSEISQNKKDNQNIERTFDKEMQMQQDAQDQNNEWEHPKEVLKNRLQEEVKNTAKNIEQKDAQASKNNENKQIIKQQVDPSDGFQPWRNKELLQEMKKYGSSRQQCLKVEYIDGLKKFETVRLNAPKMRINPFLKTRLLGGINSQKPKTFQLCALELFEKECKRKGEKNNKKS